MKMLAYISVILLTTCALSCSETIQGQDNYLKQRGHMVRTQIEARGIKDRRVLNAMFKVERHLFIPDKHRHVAYGDFPLQIGEGQTISQPYIVALMTEALELKENEKILEVGTGSGYQAAILAELAKDVYTIEIIQSLAKKAESLLKKLGYNNIHVRCGDGYLGWKEAAPFDAIIITCATSRVPEPLLEQLADGGRMILPFGGRWSQDLVLIRKKGETLERSSLGGCIFVPMTRKR